jgi:hypothetical protein
MFDRFGVKKSQRVTRPIQLLALVFLVIPAKQEMKTLGRPASRSSSLFD